MTTRTTIASAVSRYLRLPEEADDCADEVIMALERAGLVVVPREPTDFTAWRICALRPDEGRTCERCPPTVETPYGPGTQACRMHAEEIYAAAIGTNKDPTHDA
jgi:hypothetical protein